ncbi:hypothetical protein EOD42_07510 [Rhodovarius crocodyli]|uniref:Uncharacterized protein n=1 Tax=Rhodovarius crocodyli TaxID=1979269 RepID=A0A437MJ89_9PROT|nr:hypothetical protein [Rhodovarius crocodyli]RVT97655.1 hypothetical protein EOD42_07510 [Rhodovarius crocodyli]
MSELHTRVRSLVSLPDLPTTHSHVVMASYDPDKTDLPALFMGGGVSALLVVHRPLKWLDAKGLSIAKATLAEGGAIGIAYQNPVDALNARARIDVMGLD